MTDGGGQSRIFTRGAEQYRTHGARSGLTHAPVTPSGSLYHISRGLDVDSGDEDYVENNNVSKSSSYESHTALTQETRTSRE